jgi:hypothetical protein
MTTERRLNPPTTVLYIAGMGRSGSTVLDSVLGNHADLFGGGELRNLPAAGWQRNEYCACGQRVLSCPLWSQVRQRWLESIHDADGVNRLADAQRRIERTLNWRRLTADGRTPDDRVDSYIELTGALFRSIREVSHSKVVVDSSKVPARALALSLLPDVDLRIVHLVRDGRGVAWSLKKSYALDLEGGVQTPIRSKPVLRTALRWRMVNHLTEQMVGCVGPEMAVRVRYEDFAADPASTLARIGVLVGVDMSSVTNKLLADEAVSTGHTVAGNRVRMRGVIRLRADMEWRDQMGPFARMLFAVVAGRQLRRYGYL